MSQVKKGGMIGELTELLAKQIANEVERSVHDAIWTFVMGKPPAPEEATAAVGGTPAPRVPRKRAPKKKVRLSPVQQEARYQKILAAVKRFRKEGATVEGVARVTGLDKRGVAASLRRLFQKGELLVRSKKYRIS